MAVTKETGLIVANSNSYATEDEADTYHENMGNTTWAAFTSEVKEAALVRGTLMMESRFRGRWYGYQTNNNQGVAQRLAWPRKSNNTQPTQDDATVDGDPQSLVTPDGILIGFNTVPLEVQYACMEAAFMHASGSSLIPNVTGKDRYVKRNKVDVIEQEFFENSPAIDRFPLIDQLLQSLASVGGVNLSVNLGLTQEEIDSIANTNSTETYLDSLNG